MTRNELQLREKAVVMAYKVGNRNAAASYIMELYRRNKEKKFYRFRPPQMHEIDAIREKQIYLCRPICYEDSGDCEWLDDLDALIMYTLNVKDRKKYKLMQAKLTDEKKQECIRRIQEDKRYIEIKNKSRNMCLVGCITDKNTQYMWKEYAVDSEGICLEYDFETILETVSDNKVLHLCPIRYVEDRKQTKDILFGPTDYEEETPDKVMQNKYRLSCMTKDKVPYSKESEWRLLCLETNIPITQKGKSFDFIRPSKIYLGKNIDRNPKFKSGILNVADKYGIVTSQE